MRVIRGDTITSDEEVLITIMTDVATMKIIITLDIMIEEAEVVKIVEGRGITKILTTILLNDKSQPKIT